LEPLLEALYDALAQLTPREVDILRKRYSFSKGEAWTLEALGDKYGISRQRVQQLERHALKKLRQALNAKFAEK
jgi:RNA polymerase primary sigma factor